MGKTESSKIKKQEVRLLLISCIIFVAQLLRSAYSYFRPNFETNDELKEILAEMVPLTADICAWSRSISLILLSITTRKAFYYFYFNKETESVFTTSVQVIKPSKTL
uniref:Uncharacterized protein n=1 Tax=Panagrolaimus sp. PS1159 TaxID=55785 RepID=A0AC35FCY2_9BILA